jgi:predicted nuclease of restriction endonuclease-like (RecB) superfamily
VENSHCSKAFPYKNYQAFLKAAKNQILSTRLSVARMACREQIQLYWWLGEKIALSQRTQGWGKSVIEHFANDLAKAFPGSKFGFSARNLWEMRRFYLEYKDAPKLQQLVAEIPWGHHLLIMSRVKDLQARAYYLTRVRDEVWTRNHLITQIKNQAYEHQVLATKQHNFSETLPKNKVDQVDQTFKDIYTFETLGLIQPVVEHEMEARMVSKIKEVMLELGYGFAFIGNQYRLVAPSGTETFIDLLFYNRRLRALVAMELKSGAFKPEYAGRMNYRLNLLDEFVKEPWEEQSIGMILCSESNKIDVEYTLRGLDKPVGVAEFRLTKTLPKNLSNKLPEPKELERQIRQELGEENE